MVGLRDEKLLGWVKVASSSQHSPCCDHPWGGVAAGARLAKEVHKVLCPPGMPGSDVLGPRQ